MRRSKGPFLLLFLIAIFILPEFGCAQQYPDLEVSPVQVSAESVSTDFDNPWSFTFLPGGDLLVTEKEGKMFRLTDGKKTEIQGLPDVYVRGQGGLMDVETHPDFDNNKLPNSLLVFPQTIQNAIGKNVCTQPASSVFSSSCGLDNARCYYPGF